MSDGKVGGEPWDKCYQLSLVFVMLYVLCFPFFAAPLKELLGIGPEICYYKAQTGRDCIFCGTTTAVYALLRHGVLPPVHILVALGCFLAEFGRKLLLLVRVFCGRRLTVRERVADLAVTLSLLAVGVGAFLLPRG